MRNPALQQSKILIIDDEPDVVAVLRYVLEEEGYRDIKSTTNPAEAALLFAEFRPDLVVLDLVMPELSGLEVLSQLRAMIPRETYLPLLVVTGDKAKATRREALARGASDFVSKPYDITEILARVGHMLETRFLHLQPLLESKRFLQSTLDALSSRIAILDEQGTILAVNKAWVHFAPENGTDESLRGVGNNYLQLCEAVIGDSSADAAAVASGIRAVMAGHRDEFLLEYPYHSRREQRWFLVRVTRFGDDGPLRVVVAHENITERKLTEEALRASETRLRTVFDSEPECVKIVSVDGRLLDMNPAGLRMIEVADLATVSGRAVCQLVHPDDRAAFDHLHERVSRGETGQLQFRMIGLKGTERWLESHSAPLRASDGVITSVLSLTRDVTDKRLTEQSLRASEANLAAAQRIAHLGSWEVDISDSESGVDVTLICSEEMFRIAGYAPGGIEATTEAFFRLVPEEEHGLIRQALTTAIHAQVEFSVVHRLVRPDGAERVLRETGRISFDEATGQPLRMIGTTQDITEQRRAEESIRVQAHMLDNVGQSVIAVDLGGRITYANRFADELYGWLPREMLGRNILEVTVPQASSEQAQEIMAHLQRGENWSGEFLVQRRDGQSFPAFVTDSPLFDNRGQLVGIIGISNDITARKQAEAALCEAEEKYRSIFDNALEGIFQNTPEGTLFSANPALARMLGFDSPEELIRARADLARQGYADPARRLEFRRRLEEKGVITNFEYEVKRKDGSLICVSENVRVVRDAAGKALYYEGSVQDITARKLAELEIERLNADLEQRVAQRTDALLAATQEAERANRAKSEFLSRTSHELRTPLNAILGFAGLLEMDENLGPERRESINEILRSGRHLLTLIDAVLDISSADASDAAVLLEPVSVEQLIDETLCLVRPLGAAFGVEVEVTTSRESTARVLADRQRLKEALLNLLSNAIKYNHPGGRVSVQYAPAESVSPLAIRLCVKDTGPGIRVENLPRLFAPFDRLDVERTCAHIPGAGLGLALSKRMVELMGGRIGLESALGEGSVFWIELPQAEQSVSLSDREVPPPDSQHPLDSRNAGTFLHIDGNPSNVRLVARILARRPAIRLLTAATGPLGLDIAHEDCPDLILLDLETSADDSVKILTRLRANPQTAAIPVAVLSGEIAPEKRERLLVAGVHAFLSKPLEMRALLRVLDECMGCRPAVEA